MKRLAELIEKEASSIGSEKSAPEAAKADPSVGVEEEALHEMPDAEPEITAATQADPPAA